MRPFNDPPASIVPAVATSCVKRPSRCPIWWNNVVCWRNPKQLPLLLMPIVHYTGTWWQAKWVCNSISLSPPSCHYGEFVLVWMLNVYQVVRLGEWVGQAINVAILGRSLLKNSASFLLRGGWFTAIEKCPPAARMVCIEATKKPMTSPPNPIWRSNT